MAVASSRVCRRRRAENRPASGFHTAESRTMMLTGRIGSWFPVSGMPEFTTRPLKSE